MVDHVAGIQKQIGQLQDFKITDDIKRQKINNRLNTLEQQVRDLTAVKKQAAPSAIKPASEHNTPGITCNTFLSDKDKQIIESGMQCGEVLAKYAVDYEAGLPGPLINATVDDPEKLKRHYVFFKEAFELIKIRILKGE